MHVVIIGNGIAGVTCARYIRKKSNAEITIISDESAEFFSRPALMYLYMGYMQFEHIRPYPVDYWGKNRINRIKDRAQAVDVENKYILLASGKQIHWDKLVLACGSVPAKLQCPGEDLNGIQGFYHLQDLEKLQSITPTIQQAVVIGGGLIGVELAEMLVHKKIDVQLLIREKSYFRQALPEVESRLLHNHIEAHGVKILNNTTVSAFCGDAKGRIEKIVTQQGKTINANFAGICIGVQPNIAWLNQLPLEIGLGIKVNRFFETNLKDIYAIGDCAELIDPPFGHKSRETVWYTGKMHGMWAASAITGERSPYRVPVWFNSAKFFNIEYQVYGYVPAELEKNTPFESRLWHANADERLFRLVWNKQNGQIVGAHGLGVRLRQEVLNNWIMNKKSADEAIKQVKQAIFDAEFSRKIV